MNGTVILLAVLAAVGFLAFQVLKPKTINVGKTNPPLVPDTLNGNSAKSALVAAANGDPSQFIAIALQDPNGIARGTGHIVTHPIDTIKGLNPFDGGPTKNRFGGFGKVG